MRHRRGRDPGSFGGMRRPLSGPPTRCSRSRTASRGADLVAHWATRAERKRPHLRVVRTIGAGHRGGAWIDGLRGRLVLVAASVASIVVGSSSGAAAASTSGIRFSVFPIPGRSGLANPRAIAAGPDGALWFTEDTGGPGTSGVVWRSTLYGEMSMFHMPALHPNPLGITSGPDGALWFADESGSTIGRITTAGVLTEFALPEKGAPANLITGADGNLWITDHLADCIWRLTPAGGFTKFAVTTPTPSPYGIARGPDGDLWFTEAESDRIGRITTSGSILDWALPTPAAAPLAITPGPDGALYFVEHAGHGVGRITTSGVITETALPKEFGSPTDIVTGVDGVLWIISDDRTIGRLAPGGTIEVIHNDIGPGSGARGTFGQPRLTVGPDGALWFTAQWASAIGRLESTTLPNVSPTENGRGRSWIVVAGVILGSLAAAVVGVVLWRRKRSAWRHSAH